MRAAVVQLNGQDDVAANMARVAFWVAEARRLGAQLVVLPENFAFVGDEDTKRAIAESDDGRGPIVTALRALAREHEVTLVAGGMPLASADPQRPYNASLLVQPDGHIAATYRKIHLFDVTLADGAVYRESNATTPGASPVVGSLGGGITLGMTVCYDLRFPELFRKLGDLGARIVTVPSAFTLTTGKDHWHALLRARAIENQVFVLAAAQHGRHPGQRVTYGKSLIADPWGDVLAQCGEGEGVALAELDFAYQDRVRAALPCLLHRALGG